MNKLKLLVLTVFLVSMTNAVNATQQSGTASDIVDLSQYRGKVVYLDFWASWCIPCRKSFPWLNKMRQQYSNQQLAIVAINLDKEKALATQFLEQYPAEFTVLYDPKGISAKHYQIPGMPSSILIDQNGQIIHAHSGFFEKKITEYELQIAQAVARLNQQAN